MLEVTRAQGGSVLINVPVVIGALGFLQKHARQRGFSTLTRADQEHHFPLQILPDGLRLSPQ
jgi:hypothetical protein